MKLGGEVEEGLIFNDRTPDRTAELVAYQRVLYVVAVREEAIGRQSLDTVVFEQGTVPLVGAALQHGIGHEPARLAVLGGEIVADDAVLLDSVGRDRSVGAATAEKRTTTAKSLVVVIEAFYQVIAGTATGTVDRRTAV